MSERAATDLLEHIYELRMCGLYRTLRQAKMLKRLSSVTHQWRKLTSLDYTHSEHEQVFSAHTVTGVITLNRFEYTDVVIMFKYLLH